MLISDELAARELSRRLVSLEYADQEPLRIIQEYRKELADKRAEHARYMAELVNLATYRVARVEQLDAGQGLMPRDHIAEVITISQGDLPAFCKANGVNKDELMAALNHQRKETRGTNGARWQPYPLLFSETSAQGNREAREEWELETQREEKYLANRKKEGRLEYKPLPSPVHTAFKGSK